MNPEQLIDQLRRSLADAGLRGSFLARDLHSGEEIGIDPDVQHPIASLVKVPLALAVLERIRNGDLDGATAIDVEPGAITTPGPMGLSRFRHRARIAIDDLLYLSTAMSDNTAADALFDLVPPSAVAEALSVAAITGISVRHRMNVLVQTPAERFEPEELHLAHSLAIGARTPRRGHPIRQLDIGRANAASATALSNLLTEIWSPTRLHHSTAERVRTLMRDNVLRHRLAPDFSSDDATWSSKTGTLLNLRHEIGVVEHADGQVIIVAALTESTVPAAVQPAADARMAHTARQLHDYLRAR
jgi:beta-lactamase class A